MPRDDWRDEPMARGGPPTPPVPARRPPDPTEDDRERWRALGQGKFRDADYQRYAQGWRSEESLRASGKAGFAKTARWHGRDFATDVLARSRLAHPTAPERETIALLGELGQREGADYFREYRVAPGVYADFAWRSAGWRSRSTAAPTTPPSSWRAGWPSGRRGGRRCTRRLDGWCAS